MTPYERLVSEYGNLKITEQKMKCKGLYADNCIWIRTDLTDAEKVCVLAEEIGHYETSVGNIIDLTDIQNAKQEEKARRLAYERLVPIESIFDAFSKGFKEPYEIADYLGVCESFLRDCLRHYHLL